MKNASPALISLLNSGGPFYMADLYTFTLSTGTIVRYANYDMTLIYSGNTYDSNGPGFERTSVRTVFGLEVDTLDIKIWPDATDQIGGLPWIQAAARGVLDNATLSLDRAFMSSPGTIVGTLNIFSGRVSDLSMTRTEVDMTVKSDLELLNIQMPRELYQANCLHTLYDTDCGLNRASFAVTTTVLAAISTTKLNVGLTNPDGYFDLGYGQFTSGVLNGVKRTVKAYGGGTVILLNPLPQLPNSGDTMTFYPGCDKLQPTCANKFNNLVNFKGFPFIPVPETTR